MLDRATSGALCAIAAALALVALASTLQSGPSSQRSADAAKPAPRRTLAITTPEAVRALRDGQRIDLNRARPADLELLPGIGPSLAQRIVDDRSTRGAFASVDALLRVRGVGPHTLERLRGLLLVTIPEEQGRGPTE